MPQVARTLLALLLLANAGLPALAQGFQPPEDIPGTIPPQPLNPKVRDQRAALHQYVLGLLCEREDRLVEALQAWQKSAELDPEAPAVHRGLVALYIALERPTEALTATETVLALDPQDYQTWFYYARQLRAKDKWKEAAEALKRGLDCPGVKDQHELCQNISHDLGVMCERIGDLAGAVAAFTLSANRLESLDALAEVESLNHPEIQLRAAETYERIGNGYLQLKKIDQAIAAFRKAQTKYPDGAGRLNFSLAQVCLDANRIPEALTYLDRYLRLLPQGTEAYELKIKILRQQKQDGDIVAWLEKASALDHHNVGLKLLLAKQYALAKQVDRAEKMYLALLEEAPNSHVYRGLFLLYQGQGQAGMLRALTVLDDQLGQARQKQEQGSTQGPALVQALVGAFRDEAEMSRALLQAGLLARTKDLHSETLHFLAVLGENQKQWTEAEVFYRRSLSQLADPNSGTVIAGGLLRLLWKAHKHQEVVDFCRQSLKTAKVQHAVVFHSEMARALVLLDQVDESLAEVEKAFLTASNLEKSRLQVLRLRLLAQGGRYALAEKECRELLKVAILPGDQLDLYYLLASIFSLANQPARAEGQLERCLQLDPNNATIHNDLGYLLADQNKRLKEAETMIRRAIELDREQKKNNLPFAVSKTPEIQDNASYIDSLGWVLYRRGQFEAARQELERATALPDSDDPVIWDHLGDVYRQLQLTRQAGQAWEKALHFYGPEKGRKIDERYRDLQKKLKAQETSIQSH